MKPKKANQRMQSSCGGSVFDIEILLPQPTDAGCSLNNKRLFDGEGLVSWILIGVAPRSPKGVGFP
jgi:hypothetical protein